MKGQLSFTAEVRRAGINPYVEVPDRVIDVLGPAAKVPVLVRTSGITGRPRAATVGRPRADAERLMAVGRLTAKGWFRTTLIRSRSGPVRLYLDRWMRESAGVGVGDRVRITLALDEAPRDLLMPASFAEALAADGVAEAAWEALARSRRREVLTYLGFLKTSAALERNVRKVMADLRGERRVR